MHHGESLSKRQPETYECGADKWHCNAGESRERAASYAYGYYSRRRHTTFLMPLVPLAFYPLPSGHLNLMYRSCLMPNLTL